MILAVDDTVTQHRGKHVWGKACHRDAVRSSHSHTVWRRGHKWVVQSVSLPMPGCVMPWALPVQTGKGRPRIKGERLPTPEAVAKKAKLRETSVTWCGGGKRKVAVCGGEGHWYRQGKGLLWVRWVYVKDLSGTHREEYFFTTDWTLSEEEVVSLYTRRWPLEVTFQETRAQLGLNDPRQRKKESVTRMTPCLFGLYSVIALAYRNSGMPRMPGVGYAKRHATFSDALEWARRELWETTFSTPRCTGRCGKTSRDQHSTRC